MRVLYWMLSTLLMLLPLQALAAGYDGTALLQDCSAAVSEYTAAPGSPKNESIPAVRCTSFTWGAFTVLRSVQVGKSATRLLCAPATVKEEQVVRIVKKWLEEHPARLHLPAELTVTVSLREAFPCPKQQKLPRHTVW
jgi:hypothetical protein